ncbi:hypothetical protein GLOIN_2v1834436 [Rhizophagus clarus]|uniref:Tyr recombinase domain-containing protein n=1 Tax=Rhizophagus clarus TaxID=94130 RepID=A0A8H3QYB4_9GLOM|nr:hypothetical protein GLOIN_2v1834436 [Rhizophagus clarus]
MATRFVSSTKETILKFQNASRNVNTDKSNNHLSFYTGFCALVREIYELFEKIRVVNLFDIPQFKSLHRILNGHDGRIKLELPKEKNHAGGIKDPYAVSSTSFIPPDTSENVYTPVADIKKYLIKCPNNVEGKESYDTMMRKICIDSGLDFKDRNITNHSMRSMGIHNLIESGVTLDEQMTFSQHKTIAGVSVYQHQSIKRFTKASNLIENTSYVEKNELDDDLKYQKLKIPKISVENCSNININITFKCD